MKTKILFLVFAAFFLLSCTNDDELLPNEINLIGYWTDGEYEEPNYIYSKSLALKSDQYCFGFHTNGKFSERKNVGWCGTPPISYGDYEGTWSVKDSVIEINVPYWGGTAQYRWQITSLENDKLSYTVLNSDYIEED